MFNFMQPIQGKCRGVNTDCLASWTVLPMAARVSELRSINIDKYIGQSG